MVVGEWASGNIGAMASFSRRREKSAKNLGVPLSDLEWCKWKAMVGTVRPREAQYEKMWFGRADSRMVRAVRLGVRIQELWVGWWTYVQCNPSVWGQTQIS